ncbi:G1 family glutamic endopeptidase [Desulfitobacterium sp.]|uniref:G1 family glutamic endopeptidase n=1 Tax=Desulfitobacterium sp. TaxID=49981 RepID=UPI002CCEFA94|nr:G1 family glutamic endopeptidase [Desulfitobacterium sp.]HVJ49289.1 G1 family glutamic endopeptidase [Desulfitobacterium sp.]
MKNLIRKIEIVALAVALGASTLIPGVPLNQATNDAYVLAGYNIQGHSAPNVQSQQGTTDTVSLPAHTESSENWAGYIATPTSNNDYTSISGSWTVPNITASQTNALAAQWIGLGGVLTTDLLQMGTIEQMENGQAVAEIFWEKLPDVAQSVITVPIGSTINAGISEAEGSSSSWNLTYTVKTPEGETQTQTIPVTLDSSYTQKIGTSAEWISEDPSNQKSQLYPLADMGTVTYNSALVEGQPLNSSDNKVNPVAMVSKNGNVLIAPSTLGNDGESFSTTVIATNNNNSSPSVKGHNPNSNQGRIPNNRRHFHFQWSWAW